MWPNRGLAVGGQVAIGGAMFGRRDPTRQVVGMVVITNRPELWTLIARLRAWRRDYAGALDASERAWRAAMGTSGSGLLPGGSGDAAASRDWTVDPAAWNDLVTRTDELVSAFEKEM